MVYIVLCGVHCLVHTAFFGVVSTGVAWCILVWCTLFSMVWRTLFSVVYTGLCGVMYIAVVSTDVVYTGLRGVYWFVGYGIHCLVRLYTVVVYTV